MADRFAVSGELWIWRPETGKGSWHFLTIGGDAAEDIRTAALLNRLELGLPKKRGWGAVKVQVTIGETVWKTSIFPESGGNGFLLPIKAAVRKAESLVAGDRVEFELEPIFGD